MQKYFFLYINQDINIQIFLYRTSYTHLTSHPLPPIHTTSINHMHREIKDTILQYITKMALSNKQNVIDLEDEPPNTIAEQSSANCPTSPLLPTSAKNDELSPQMHSQHSTPSQPEQDNRKQNSILQLDRVENGIEQNNELKKQQKISKQVQKNDNYQYVQEDQENKIASQQASPQKPKPQQKMRPRGRPKSKANVKVLTNPKTISYNSIQKGQRQLIPLDITIPLTIGTITLNRRSQSKTKNHKQSKIQNHITEENSVRLIAKSLRNKNQDSEVQIKHNIKDKPILKRSTKIDSDEIAISSTSSLSNQQQSKEKPIRQKIKNTKKIQQKKRVQLKQISVESEQIRVEPKQIRVEPKLIRVEPKQMIDVTAHETVKIKKIQNKDNDKKQQAHFDRHGQQDNRSKGFIDLDRFFERRQPKQNQKIDLGVYSLSEILEKANFHELISNELYYEFIRVHKQEKLLSFIHMVANNTLTEWDSAVNKFTIADHRRLAQLMVKIFPSKYILTSPQSLNSEVNEFVFQLYSLSKNKYNQLMRELDKQFQLNWWKSLQIKYYQFLHERADTSLKSNEKIEPTPKSNKYLSQNSKSKEQINLHTYREQVLGQLNKKYKLGNSNTPSAQSQSKKPTRQQNSKYPLYAQLNNYNNLTRALKAQKPVKIEAEESKTNLKRSYNINYRSEQQRNYDVLTKRLRK